MQIWDGVFCEPGAHAARLEYAQADRVIEDEARLFEPSTSAAALARPSIVSGGGGGGSHTMIGVGF